MDINIARGPRVGYRFSSMSSRPPRAPPGTPAGALRRESCCPPSAGSIAACPPIFGEPLEGKDAAELASRLKVLADPGRLRLLGLIKSQPKGEACVCNLTTALGLSQPTVTHHLQVLHRAGFLARERRGVWVWYRVVPQALAAIRRALA